MTRSPPSRRWPLVIVAHTLPVRRVTVQGRMEWRQSPGGLVSALAPIVRQRAGAWIGWTGAPDNTPKPFEHDGIVNLPVLISRTEARNHYQGFCNRTLWPLYHDAIREPVYHRSWWRHYTSVNERFAELAAEVTAPEGTVWIHDYHLQLVPALLRSRRPDVRIGFFLHIPFPPQELYVRLPWRADILRGLLGADVIGLQTKRDAQNLLAAATALRVAERDGRVLAADGHESSVGPFPISIDYDRFDRCARTPDVERRAQEFRDRLGQGRKIVLGVDRLDYTKGIDLRLEAYADLLHSHRTTPRDSVLIQVGVPSRERISEYRELRRRVEELVGAINGDYGEVGIASVHYLRRNLPFEELVAMYYAADVMLVTPLRDGMNLVAKEYVACRTRDTGALVLSEFAGAAAELRSALHVNPHDVDGVADAVHRAVTMPLAEQRRRMRALRRIVSRNTVHDWAASFLDALRTDR